MGDGDGQSGTGGDGRTVDGDEGGTANGTLTSDTAPLGPARPRARDAASRRSLDEAEVLALYEVDPAHYELRDVLARGGMGQVVRARDRRARRVVAIKEIRGELLSGASESARRRILLRFEREARITARLQHPGIVPVYEVGRFGTEPFYAMKVVAGRPLREIMAETRTADERLALLPHAISVVEALAYAHEQGVIHRDLKPSNILVGAHGETVVIDWGLAKVLDEEALGCSIELAPASAEATVAGTVLGTPAYMSPEQASGREADERSDVYALGAILYQLLSGVPPFSPDRDSPDPVDDLVARVREESPPPLSEVAPRVPADLQSIVDKAMRREPGERYSSAADLAADLNKFSTGKLVGVHEYRPRELVVRWLRRHRAAVITASVLLAVLAVLAVVSAQQVVSARDRAREERDRAEAAKTTAVEERDRAVLLVEELGRTELEAGRPFRAAAFLSEAYSLGRRGQVLRVLLADAMRQVDALERTIGPRPLPVAVAFDPTGRRFLAQSSGWSYLGAFAGPDLGVFELRGGGAKFSPDGERFANALTTIIDGSKLVHLARVYDAATGETLASLSHEHDVTALAWGPDGSYLATGARDNTVSVWSGPGLGQRRVLRGHRDQVGAIAVSPDGARLATADLSDTIYVWDPSNGRVLQGPIDNGRGVVTLRYSPDGKWLASCGGPTAEIWNAATGAHVDSLHAAGGAFYLAFAPAGDRIATTAKDGSRDLWDGASMQRLAHLAGAEHAHPDDGNAAERTSFSHDGRYVVAAHDSALIWDAGSGTLLGSIDGHEGSVCSAGFVSGHDVIITSGYDGTVKLWRANAVLAATRVLGGDVTVAAASPSGSLLALGSFDGGVDVWDPEGARRWSGRHDDSVTAIAFSADGKRIVTASADGTAQIWNARSGEVVTRIAVGAPVSAVALSRGGKRLASASGAKADDQSVAVWDAASGRKLAEIDDGERATIALVRFVETGRLLTMSLRGQAVLWDAESGSSVRRFGDKHDHYTMMNKRFGIWHTIGTDDGPGNLMVIVDGGNVPRVWDRATGAVVFELGGHAGEVTAAVFSPDGHWLATCSDDRTVRLWNASTGAMERVLLGHAGKVWRVAFTPDSKRLASAGDDAVLVWDVDSGALIKRIEGVVRELFFLAPEGHRLLLLGDEGPARLVRVDVEQRSPEEIAAIVAARVPWRIVDGKILRRSGQTTPASGAQSPDQGTSGER